MKYLHIFLLSIVFSLASFVLACSSRPTQMIQLTEQARTEAISEHSDFFAPDLWAAGEKAWQEANAQLDAKNYREADSSLLRAKTNFVKARDSAKSRREAAESYISNMRVTIGIRIKSDLTENPAASKLSPARKKEFDAAVKDIEDNSMKVETLVNNGQYAEARNLVDRTMRSVYDTQQEFLKK